MNTSTISYNLKSIGQIVNSIEDIKDMPILGVKSKIEIDSQLIDGLVGLNDYSHIIVLAFISDNDFTSPFINSAPCSIALLLSAV